MLLLRQRLKREYRYKAYSFGYPSVGRTLDENARALADFIAEQGFDGFHLVGHSLGGVVALRALALQPGMPADRIVCVGSPLCGSRVASKVSRQKWGAAVLGKSISAGVVAEAASQWASAVCESHDVGVIAGTVSAGLGRFVTSFDEENDGTIGVSETRLPGIKDHLCVATGHSALVVSGQVAHQVAAFLKRGEFMREN